VVPDLVERLAALRLELHRDRIHVSPSSAGRTFVGYRVTPAQRRISNANVRAFLRRLGWVRRALARRRLSRDEVQRRLMGWLGHAARADFLPLISQMATQWVFRRGRFHSFRPTRVAQRPPRDLGE
jgi:hypothetical protein